tara:strand:- start:322 stop:543 length:222 start_codon:yes stop_codon:yes gene_type:complete
MEEQMSLGLTPQLGHVERNVLCNKNRTKKVTAEIIPLRDLEPIIIEKKPKKKRELVIIVRSKMLRRFLQRRYG